MNDNEVSKQVQQMVQFIRQEAEEKANEISVSAEEVTILGYHFLVLQTIRVFPCREKIDPQIEPGASEATFHEVWDRCKRLA